MADVAIVAGGLLMAALSYVLLAIGAVTIIAAGLSTGVTMVLIIVELLGKGKHVDTVNDNGYRDRGGVGVVRSTHCRNVDIRV
jgi:hypothetical protein